MSLAKSLAKDAVRNSTAERRPFQVTSLGICEPSVEERRPPATAELSTHAGTMAYAAKRRHVIIYGTRGKSYNVSLEPRISVVRISRDNELLVGG